MRVMSEPMNARQNNMQSNNQGYTYSHYYRNKRPYYNSNNNYNQNFNNSRDNYSRKNNVNNNLKNNTYNGYHNTNTNCSSKDSTYNYASSNAYNEDSLLLNDVYGKNYSSCNKENVNNQSSNCSSENNFDFSSLFNNFFQNNNNSNNNYSSDNTSNSANNSNINFSDFFNNSNMPDMETLLKFKKIFECLNSKSKANDPIVNLLFAIKPFIKDSKKSLIDQFTKFISISSVLQEFNTFL